MVFSYNWLQSFFDKKILSPEKLAEILTLRFAEVEKVSKKGIDFILDIDIRPNRARDSLSHLGIAREISAILNLKYQIPNFSIKKNNKLDIKDFISVKINNKKDCLRYVALVIKDVSIGPSPKWIKERLGACNIKSVNNVVDIANYVMLETGQPLHAFDFNKIEGKEIIVRSAKNNEKITVLDGGKYDLHENILVIADKKEPLAIAGIKGGEKAEIDKKTNSIVLESANFFRGSIRFSSKKLNLKTDASLRFDHGVDPNIAKFAILRAGFLIQQLTGGKATHNLIDFYFHKDISKKIDLSFSKIESLLGIKIKEKEVVDIIKRVGVKVLKKKNKSILVEIPSFRQDILIQEDLIEEIGRIYGYEKIPLEFPLTLLIPPKKNLDIFWEDLTKRILKEMGFSEVLNYSLISETDVKKINFDNLFEIENPISSDYKYLRPSLITGLIKNIINNQSFIKFYFKNQKEQNSQNIRIFELGRVFNLNKKNYKEKKMLSGAIVCDLMADNNQKKETFFILKGIIDSLFKSLGISNFWYDDYKPTPEDSKISIWNKERCAEIKIGNQEIGFLGEISKNILKNYNSEFKIFVFDLDFEELLKLSSEEQQYRPISKYPTAIRDLAVLVPSGIKVENVLNVIETSGGLLVRDIDLFDIYEGSELPNGKKNLAFRIIYQSDSKTLSSEEIEKIQQKIIKSLEENTDWEVRKQI